jgi:hypothetical protein
VATPVVITAGEDCVIDFPLEEVSQIRGTLTSDGEPLLNARVVVYDAG